MATDKDPEPVPQEEPVPEPEPQSEPEQQTEDDDPNTYAKEGDRTGGGPLH